MKLHGLAIACALSLVICGSAWAQQYKVIPMNAPELNPDDAKTRGAVTAAKIETQEYLRRKPIDDAGKQLMTRFFMGAYFPSWTNPAYVTSVDVKRRDFMRNFNGPLDTQLTSKKELNRLALQAMSEMIKPDYHPVVRYNAMMLIGDLNAQEFDLGTKAPVCPYHASLDVMLKTLEDPNSDDMVRVAAMLGVLRHARYAQSLPKPPGEAVTFADLERIMKVASQTITAPVAEGRSEDAHQWTQRRAMDVVRALSPGFQKMFDGGNANAGAIRKSLEDVAKSLGQMVEDENADKAIRLDAAQTLAMMPSDDAVKKSFDPNLQVGMVAKLASKSVDDDVTWFTEKLKEMKMGGQLGGGAYPGSMMEGPSYGGGGISSMDYGDYADGPEGGPGGKKEKPKKKEFVNTNPPLHSLQLTFRRRVKSDVDALKVSLVGPDGTPADIREAKSGLIRFVPSAEEQAAILDLSKAMDELIVAADAETSADAKTPMGGMGPMGTGIGGMGAADPYLPYEDLAKNVKEKQAKLERLANKLAANAGISAAEAAGEVTPSADMPFGAVPGAAPGVKPAAPPTGGKPAATSTPAAATPPSADMPFGPVPGAPAAAGPAGGAAAPMPAGN